MRNRRPAATPESRSRARSRRAGPRVPQPAGAVPARRAVRRAARAAREKSQRRDADEEDRRCGRATAQRRHEARDIAGKLLHRDGVRHVVDADGNQVDIGARRPARDAPCDLGGRRAVEAGGLPLDRAPRALVQPARKLADQRMTLLLDADSGDDRVAHACDADGVGSLAKSPAMTAGRRQAGCRPANPEPLCERDGKQQACRHDHQATP